MTLQVPEPPAEVTAIMQGAVELAADRRSFRTPSLRTLRPDEQLEATDPHEVYTMGLDDLRRSAALDSARPASWRFLLRGANGVLAAAECARSADGDYQITTISEGKFVSATSRTLAALRSDARLEPAPFTPQILHIPALHAMAMWLRHEGPDDLLVPMRPFPLDIPAGLLMSASDLLGRLQVLASRVDVEAAEGTKGH